MLTEFNRGQPISAYAGLFIRMAWHGAVLTVQSTVAVARVVVTTFCTAESYGY